MQKEDKEMEMIEFQDRRNVLIKMFKGKTQVLFSYKTLKKVKIKELPKRLPQIATKKTTEFWTPNN